MTRALYFVLPLALMSQTPHYDPLYKRLQRLYFLSVQNATYLQPFEDTLQILAARYGPYPTIQLPPYKGRRPKRSDRSIATFLPKRKSHRLTPKPAKADLRVLRGEIC
jgi:hypothetical protein